MKVLIKTKSNYRDLNGTWLQVHECVGTRVSCIVKDESAHKGQLIIDFNLSEVVEITYNRFINKIS